MPSRHGRRALCFGLSFRVSSFCLSVMLWLPIIILVSFADILLRLYIYRQYVSLQTRIDFKVTRSRVKTTWTICVKTVSSHYLSQFYRFLLKALYTYGGTSLSGHLSLIGGHLNNKVTVTVFRNQLL